MKLFKLDESKIAYIWPQYMFHGALNQFSLFHFHNWSCSSKSYNFDVTGGSSQSDAHRFSVSFVIEDPRSRH